MAEKKVVLVIDDDPEILKFTKVVLDAEGFETETAISGKESLELLKKIKPDLILCDMMMERIDAGVGVAHEIREKDKEVPIFLLSSIGDVTASNVDIYDLGFNGVLQKPVDTDTLISTVKRTLKKK